MTTFAAQWTPGYSAASQWAIHGNKPGARDMLLSIPTASIGENQDAPFYARIYDKTDTLVVAAGVYDILVRVYDGSGTEVYGDELTPADTGLAGLVTTAPWSADGTGYNFVTTIPGRGVFLAGGGTYRVEFTLEMTDEDAIQVVGDLKVRPSNTYKSNQIQ